MGLQRVRHDWVTKQNSPIFIPDTFSREEEGFLSLFYLHQKCQGIGAGGAGWVLLICKVNLIIMRAQWANAYIWMQEIPAFPALSLSATLTLITQNCCLLSVWSFLASFVCLWNPAVDKMSDFLPPGHCPHFSVPTPLPACSNRITYC